MFCRIFIFCSVIACVFAEGVELNVSEICKKCVRFSGTSLVVCYLVDRYFKYVFYNNKIIQHLVNLQSCPSNVKKDTQNNLVSKTKNSQSSIDIIMWKYSII